MSFVLIVGPMKSGKSLELIARVAPYEFANQKVLYVQPKADTRDAGIRSRLGVNTDAVRVSSLASVDDSFDVVGVDEIHMFEPQDADVIEAWLEQGKTVFVSGLDLDYRGKMPPIVARLMEIKPDAVVSKKAVCDICKKYEAQFSQIVHNGEPILSGLPLITPEDGTYEYQARCRNCFVRAG